MVARAFLLAIRANFRLLATFPILLCALLPGPAGAEPATSTASWRPISIPLVGQVWFDQQLRLLATWWQTIQSELSTFPNGPLLAVARSNVANRPLLFGAIAVAVCSFLALLWVGLRRRRAIAPTPAVAGNLAGVYRQYERSDSVPRRARRSGATVGSGTIDTTVKRVPLQANRGAAQVLGWLQTLDNGRRIPLTERTVKIGRHSSNLVILEDTTVHRYHATLELNARGQFELKDLGGANGTFVNGTRCQHKELADGDVLELGTVRMRFQVNRQVSR